LEIKSTARMSPASAEPALRRQLQKHEIRIWFIWICFEIRASDFGFVAPTIFDLT
jgi:hypothetical protein